VFELCLPKLKFTKWFFWFCNKVCLPFTRTILD